jgi:hypothetical protein
VRGLGAGRELSESEPPHPTLSPTGRGPSSLNVAAAYSSGKVQRSTQRDPTSANRRSGVTATEEVREPAAG